MNACIMWVFSIYALKYKQIAIIKKDMKLGGEGGERNLGRVKEGEKEDQTILY